MLFLSVVAKHQEPVRNSASGRLVVRFEFAGHNILADFLFEPRAHGIMIIEIDHMDGVRDCKFAVPFDDQEDALYPKLWLPVITVQCFSSRGSMTMILS